MLRQLESSLLLREQFPHAMLVAFGGAGEVRPPVRQKPSPRSIAAKHLPSRPDASVINETIPLFYIGQNRKGRWVVRESEGRSGGLFLFKQWAVRFARRQSEPRGCAIMFLAEPIELEIDGQGKCADSRGVNERSSREAQNNDGLLATIAALVRRLARRFSRNLAAQRRNREAIERELFGGRCTLTSKSDDDLPVVR